MNDRHELQERVQESVRQGDRLVELLRDADPAAGIPELTSAQVEALRRAAFRALPDETSGSRPFSVWSVVLAAAAVALVALGLVFAIHLTAPEANDVRQAHEAPMEPAAHGNPSPATAPTVTPMVARALPAPSPAASEGAEPLRSPAPRRPRREPATPEPRLADVGTASPTEAEGVVPTEQRHPVQIQLTAPGGTRIVWVLASPTSG
jgi:hypothetical protein